MRSLERRQVGRELLAFFIKQRRAPGIDMVEQGDRVGVGERETAGANAILDAERAEYEAYLEGFEEAAR